MQDVFHIRIVTISHIIYLQKPVVIGVSPCLVKYAEYHVEPVVDLAMQPGNLDYDAVVGQAVHKGIRQTFGHQIAIIVERLVIHINDRLLYITDLMPQQIDSHHGEGIAIIPHILGIRIVHAQILPESQGLRVEPGFLQFYQNQFLMTILLPDGCPEINTENRKGITCFITILMRTDLNFHHVLLQQGRENRTSDSLVLHQIFEYNIINWVCYYHLMSTSFNLAVPSTEGLPSFISNLWL